MFYDRFIALCKLKGIQPAKVARDLGLNQSTVSMWKSQGTTPNAATLNKLAKYFDTSMDYLLQVRLDDQTRQFLDRHPNTPIIDEGDKISIQISGPDEELDDEGLRQKSLFEFYSRLTERGREKVCDYAFDLSQVPEYQNDEYMLEQAKIKKYMKSLKDTNGEKDGGE